MRRFSRMQAVAAVLSAAWVLLLVQSWCGLGWEREMALGGNRAFKPKMDVWQVRLPKELAGPLAALRGELREDGRPLFRAGSLDDVEEEKAGRWRLRGQLLTLATPDGSNPNTNGRRYTFRAPRPIPAWLVWAGLAVVVGANVVARKVGGPVGSVPVSGTSGSHVSGWIWATGVFVLSAAVRLILVLAWPEPNDGFMIAKGVPYSDAAGWLETGRHLSEGRGLVGAFGGHRPLYTVLVAGLHALPGSPMVLAQCLNALLGALTATVLGLLLAGVAGRAAGLALAVYLTIGGAQAAMLALPMTETASLSLLAVSMALLWRGAEGRRYRDLLGGGIFFGLSNLACPFTLLALPALGVVAAAGRDGWFSFLRRGAVVALGAALVVVPWVVRQKVVWGVATISLNSSQMLYAMVSPAGRYRPEVIAEAEASFQAGGEAARARYYSQRFGAEVRRDPARYLRLVSSHMGWWIQRFDRGQPVFMAAIALTGLLLGLRGWWLEGKAGGLILAAGAPVLAALGAHGPGGVWLAVAAAGALATRHLPRLRLAALLLVLIAGCAVMNGLTAQSLAKRIWIMADWAMLSLALLAVANLAGWLVGNRDQAPGVQPWERAAGAAPSGLRFVTLAAAVQGGMVVLALAWVGYVSLRGPLPQAPPPTVEATQAATAVETTLERSGLAAEDLEGRRHAIWSGLVTLSRPRAHLATLEACGHWSRALQPRPEERTVIRAPTPDGTRTLTLQVPGDWRDPSEGRTWFVVGVLNGDPKPRYESDGDMLEVLALWPVTVAPPPAASSIVLEKAGMVFPASPFVRSLLQQTAPK